MTSDQIGLNELKRRVGEALEKIMAEIEALPESERPTTTRQIAEYVGRELDEETVAAVFREGLLRIVRRLNRKRNQRLNKAKQAGKREEGDRDSGGMRLARTPNPEIPNPETGAEV